MPELTSLFPDVADALDIESVAIVEKDYFVVDLLRLLKEIKPETHTEPPRVSWRVFYL